jgi:riboflavin kinase/FMN adenylyltransferase
VRLGRQWRDGMLYIGSRPTFYWATKQIAVEVHIFDFKKNIYGRHIEVVFVKKIRDEQTFSSVLLLKEQMEMDQKKAERILRAAKK